MWKREHELWQKENELVDNRLGWLGFTQPLLFTGIVIAEHYGFDLGKQIAWFGLLTSSFVLIGVIAAAFAQHRIAVSDTSDFSGIHPLTTFFGWVPGLLIPLAFVSAWVICLCFLMDEKGKLRHENPNSFELRLGKFEMKLAK